MDAMANAVDEAALMIYGVSLAYKERENCRMEANYAHQTELDMIPVMLQVGYKANDCEFATLIFFQAFLRDSAAACR